MALHTATLVLDETWRLISNSLGRLKVVTESVEGALFYFGDAAPAASYAGGQSDRRLDIAALETKVWAKAALKRAQITVTRVVDAANYQEIILGDLGLSASSFASTLLAGADVATITGRVAGDSVKLLPVAGGLIEASSDATKLVRALGPISVKTPEVVIELEQSHPLAANSPKRTKFTVKVTGSLGAGGGGAMVLRGYNPGMTVSANSVRIGGANRSLACAITRKFPFTFRRFKVVQQVFSPVNRVDTLYDKATKFAHAFAPAGRTTFTGIAARTIKAAWNGADFLNYDPATWDGNVGHAVSDWIDLGVETDTIDCWETAVAPASITAPSGHFYAMETVADNLIQHGAGTFASTSDIIADGSWLTVNALTAAPANAAGSNSFMSPAMYLIEVPGTTKCVLVYGDSHSVGLNSGGGATQVDSVQYGGPMGTDKLAMSWLDRGISDLGIGYCRIGQGGDGDRYWGPNPNNWRFRKALGVLAAPTHGVDESATNDMGVVGSQSNVDPGKTFVRGAALRHIGAGRVYLCTQAGDINGQMPEGTSADVLGTEITSGTAKFTCTGTFSAALFNATAVLGVQMMMADQIKAQWPGIPLIRCGLLPDATSNNNFADLAGQTPNGVFGQGAASKRGQYLQLQKSAVGKALLRYDFAWYPEQFIENDPANYDSLIKPDAAVPDKLMFSSHLTSYGHHVARQAVTPQALA